MLCTVWNFNTLNSNSFQFLRGIDMESDNMKKALIAMSGGVDSSVAAYLMKEHGYDCIGVTMKLFQNEDAGVSRKKSCCSLDDVEDARSVAHNLGIPYYVFNSPQILKNKLWTAS